MPRRDARRRVEALAPTPSTLSDDAWYLPLPATRTKLSPTEAVTGNDAYLSIGAIVDRWLRDSEALFAESLRHQITWIKSDDALNARQAGLFSSTVD